MLFILVSFDGEVKCHFSPSILFHGFYISMSQKRKIQVTIGEMYGWTKGKTSKTQK
jgi:hypothetical protein